MKYRRTVNIDFDTRCKKLETALKRFYAKYPELEKDSREQYEYMYENGIEHEDNAPPTDRDAWTWCVWLCHDDGYFYFAWIEREPEEAEPEQPETETAEADETETETNEQEEPKMKYDYVESMKRDILDYIADEIDRADYDDRDELETALNDDLWPEDAITGNGCWGYGKYHKIPDETIRDYVRENLDLCKEALREFCTEKDEIIDKFFDDDYSYFDCTIRCYCLNWAISKALDELEESGYFDNGENEES